MPSRTPQPIVHAIAGGLRRRIDRLCRRAEIEPAELLQMGRVQHAIELAGLATQVAFREQRISEDEACLRIPEAIGFVLLEQLRKHPVACSQLDLLALVRHARRMCRVDPLAYISLRSLRQAA